MIILQQFHLYKLLVIENNFNEPFLEDYLKSFNYRKINRIAVNDFYLKDIFL